ncbi:MAG: hypothetical protein K8R02_04920 [Anaerohalosphaeraceae bacterium]|nr:hypothetical protein [Anaerohalosphaeraceae bacterium]
MKTILTMLTALLIASTICLTGCGQNADETTPIDTIKAQIVDMDTAKLKVMAFKYKDAIIAKKDEVSKVMAKLKEIPVTEALGDDAKEIKNELTALTDSVSALKARFDLYYNKLKADGGDVSGLEL